MMVKVATGVSVASDKISLVGVYEGACLRKRVKVLNEQGRFLNLTRGKKVKSVILYEQGGLEYGIFSPLACDTIIGKINEASSNNVN